MAITKKAPSWERSTKEVLFLQCPSCSQRLEVDIDNQGTAVTRLYTLLRAHNGQCSGAGISLRELQRLARPELVKVTPDIDLEGIISTRQLRRRARRLAANQGISRAEALEQVRSKLAEEITRDGLFTCSHCGKPISKHNAETTGLGPKCAKLEVVSG